MVLIFRVCRFFCLGMGFRVWGIGIILLALSCSNPYEQDNPTDSIFVYSVSFNAGEATGGTLPAALSGSWGDTIQLPGISNLEKEGYVLCWVDGNAGIIGVAGSSYVIKGNIALYSRWLPAYTVTFDGNGATGGTPPVAVKVDSVSNAILFPDAGGLERSGYAFDGWAIDVSGAGTNYNAGSSYTVTGDITLYAVWFPFFGTNFCDTRDGQRYKIATIGEEVWFAENLNYNAEGSKCYNNDPANCEKYGRLYDWSTAMTLCPSGWHLPSDDEWDALITAVGGSSNAGTKLKATSGWSSNGNGTDDYGFSALPGGDGYSDGGFINVEDYGDWWSSTEYDSYYAYGRSMGYNDGIVYRLNNDKSFLFSVRCLQD